MSNFADRLVARSAGALPAPGIAVLTPRPASRFEVPPAAGIEAADGLVPGAEDVGLPIDAQAPLIGPAIAPPTKSIEGAPGATAAIASPEALDDAIRKPRHESDAPIPPPAREPVEAPPPQSGELPISRALRDRSGRASIAEPGLSARATPLADGIASTDVADVVRPNAMMPPSVSEEVQVDRELPRRFERIPDIAVVTGEPGRSSALQSWGAPGDRTEAPAPVISIGKIEVQFLPQVPPLPAPRAEPQRTRGLQAYARARRGEPR
jgi:hypothetical protein